MAAQTHQLKMGVIDLVKAGQVDCSGFVVRAMIAANEVYGSCYFGDLLSQDRQSNPGLRHLHNGLSTHILRMQISIVVEAVVAFEEEYRAADYPSIEALHDKYADLMKAKKLFYDLASQTDFKYLKILRNNFGYHFNFGNKGQLTENALSKLIQSLDPRVAASAPLFQGGTHGKHFRFLLADEVMEEAWQRAFGGPDLDKPGIDRTQVLKDRHAYVMSLCSAFHEWATELMLAWLQEYGLGKQDKN